MKNKVCFFILCEYLHVFFGAYCNVFIMGFPNNNIVNFYQQQKLSNILFVCWFGPYYSRRFAINHYWYSSTSLCQNEIKIWFQMGPNFDLFDICKRKTKGALMPNFPLSFHFLSDWDHSIFYSPCHCLSSYIKLFKGDEPLGWLKLILQVLHKIWI